VYGGCRKLELIKPCIKAGELEELGVGALFHECTMMKDENAVSALDGGEAVCDNDRGAPCHECFERVFDAFLEL
jgi:hypothetical protein